MLLGMPVMSTKKELIQRLKSSSASRNCADLKRRSTKPALFSLSRARTIDRSWSESHLARTGLSGKRRG